MLISMQYKLVAKIPQNIEPPKWIKQHDAKLAGAKILFPEIVKFLCLQIFLHSMTKLYK